MEWVWLVVLLPLAGFVANGTLSFYRPDARRAVSVIGVGALGAALVVAVAVVAGAVAAPDSLPAIFTYWQWMPVGALQVDAALQVDQLSCVMLLVVTGVGTLIHVFSVGYMRHDAGLRSVFRLPESLRVFHVGAGAGCEFPGDVCRMGGPSASVAIS